MTINIEKLAWKKMNGLIPTIIQHANTGVVLMLGYMTLETLKQTIETKQVTFYSRSKNRPWVKGETSGNVLVLSEITSDCDGDALLILADPKGSTCHTGSQSCFGDACQTMFGFIEQLTTLIADRNTKRPPNSYTTSLFDAGIKRIAQKVSEEGVEVALAAIKESYPNELCQESADLFFHWLVLLEAKNFNIFDVLKTLRKRYKKSESS